MERPITEVVTKMNEQWSVVTTLKRGWLSTMFSINCLKRLFQLQAFWTVSAVKGRFTAFAAAEWLLQAGRGRGRSGQWRETHQKLDRVHSCTSMPLVLLYIAPWSQWSFCSTGDVCIAKQGSYRSTCSHSPRFILWGQKKGDRGNGKVRHGLAPPSG